MVQTATLALGEPRNLAVAMGSVTVMVPVRALACACARQATGVRSVLNVEMATMKLFATTATWYVRNASELVDAVQALKIQVVYAAKGAGCYMTGDALI